MTTPRAFTDNELFSVLSKDDLAIMKSLAHQKSLVKGDYLVRQEEAWPNLFFIEIGSIIVEKDSADGRTLIAGTFKRGDVFWGITFFLDGVGMPAGLQAFEDTRLLQWSRADIIPIIKNNGLFSWELSRLAMGRILYASEILESMTFHPIGVRLARLLMGISGGENQVAIERNLTLDDMAARIGSTREMVCRLLYKFSDEGLIRITRTEFTIMDQENLEKKAQL